MTGLLFALLATLIVGIGGRDQMLVAQLSARQGARPALLLVAIGAGLLTAALAAWGGAMVAGMMAGNARLFLVALALGLAGLEMIFVAPRRAPSEPTASLGAFAIVVFAAQLTDAARFVIFALTALTRAPITAGLGGGVGAAAVLALGWLAFDRLHSPLLTQVRRWLGAALAVLALAIGAQALGHL